MDPHTIINRYYPQSPLRDILLIHSDLVAKKALEVAEMLNSEVDCDFLYEISILHDIGIFRTDAPDIHCYGSEPYIRHGIIGADILSEEGYPRHAAAVARHIGVGLSKQEIVDKKLPLPPVDLVPTSLEEEILVYADLFYSKAPERVDRELPLEEVRAKQARFGVGQLEVFSDMHRRFSCE